MIIEIVASVCAVLLTLTAIGLMGNYAKEETELMERVAILEERINTIESEDDLK